VRKVGLCLLLIMAASAACADEAQWLRQLGSEDPQEAQAAVTHFVSQGAAAVPMLVQGLKDKNLLVQQYAAAALARLGLPGADEALLRTLMSTRNDLLAQFCGEALAARGQAIVPLLRHALALDLPLDPARTDGRTEADEKLEYARMTVFAASYALPPDLALPLCAEYVSTPEGNHTPLAKVLFADQGMAGMRLWAKSFLTRTELPDIATANKAWDARNDDWDDLSRHWSMSENMHPSLYEIALDNDEAQATVRRVIDEATKSPSATERLWGTCQILAANEYGKADDQVDLSKRVLADRCWLIPFTLLEGQRQNLDEDQARKLVPALRRLTRDRCKALRCLATEMLAESADPAALNALERMLRKGSDRERVEAGWIISDNNESWTDAQKLRFLEPLLAANKPSESTYIAYALYTMPASAWSSIAKALRSPDPATRADGADILGHLEAKEAAPILVRALDDSQAEVRGNALKALATILHEDARPHIQRVFDRGGAASQRLAYEAARVAEDPALLARIILAKPELCARVREGEDVWESAPGIPVVRRGRSEKQDEIQLTRTVIPELVEVARRLFADERQPDRVRLVAAEAILDASVPCPREEEAASSPNGAKLAAYFIQEWRPDKPLSPLPVELWPVLEFALQHFPWEINWSPSEIAPVVNAAYHVRNPEAVPILAGTLRTMGSKTDRGWANSELLEPVMTSLLQIRPQGEEAFWQALQSGNLEWQTRVLLLAYNRMNERQLLSPEKLSEACVRLLQQKVTTKQLLTIAGVVPPGTEAATLTRRMVREAYAHWTPGEPMRIQYLRALSALKDPELETLYLQSLRRRDTGFDRGYVAEALKGFNTPEAFNLALSIAGNEFESYSVRYHALRVVEAKDKARAREIATKWTHDQRYRMRNCGRSVLAGEPKMYL